MTVEEMLNRISCRELDEWMAYDQVEPIGDWRGDLRNSLLCTLLANIHRNPLIKPEPFVPSDYIVDFWTKIEEQPKPPVRESWKNNLALAEMLTVALGGQDLRGK